MVRQYLIPPIDLVSMRVDGQLMPTKAGQQKIWLVYSILVNHVLDWYGHWSYLMILVNGQQYTQWCVSQVFPYHWWFFLDHGRWGRLTKDYYHTISMAASNSHSVQRLEVESVFGLVGRVRSWRDVLDYYYYYMICVYVNIWLTSMNHCWPIYIHQSKPVLIIIDHDLMIVLS